MQSKTLILSASGLRNIVFNNQRQEEFVFVFGKKEIRLPKVFAEFISPIVSHLHQCDPTINLLDFDKLLGQTKSHIYEKFQDIFNDNTISQIIQLSQGFQIILNEENDKEIENLLYLSIILGNDELNSAIKTNFKKKIKRKDEILDNIQIYYELSQKFPQINISSLIDELANQISTEDEQKLRNLPIHIFYLILNSDQFKFNNSDILLDIINEHFSKSQPKEEEISNINYFYELVDISQLSLSKFSELLSKIDYTKLTSEMWRQICEFVSNKDRLQTPKNVEKMNIELKYDGNQEHLFEGIIHHLSKSEEKNIHDLKIINVSSSNTLSGFPAKNAVDFRSNNLFHSHTGSSYNSWLKYDFNNYRIRPSSYSIRTRDDSDDQNPMNWCIEVSNTDRDDDWKVIDNRTNAKLVSKAKRSCNYTTDEVSGSFRYVRLRQTGPTSNDSYDLVISALEYFGKIENA